MENKNRQKGNNVVPIPNLERRLLDLGMQALNNREFKEALQYFNQLTEENNNYREVEIGIVVCLLELGLYEDAKEKCERLLQEDIGDYFNVLQIYINILIQLGEYETIVHTLEVIFEEEKVPSESAETLFHLMEFSRKKLDGQISSEDHDSLDIHSLEQHLLYGEVEQQFLVIHKLREYPNIYNVLDSIKEVLNSQDYHPLVQSMLLQLLIERNVNELVSVQKFRRSIVVDPSALTNSFERPFTREVLNKLDDVLGQENPTLYEASKELWERYLFVLFPFEPEPKDTVVWAAALHKTGYEYYGIDLSMNDLVESYQVEKDGIIKASFELLEVEKLSNLSTNL